jgi:hypothetical protein
MKAKMKLKTAKYLMIAGDGVAILLLVAGVFIKARVIQYVGLGVAFAVLIFWMIFGHCPACGSFLGRISDRQCPNCNEKLDW